MVDMASLQSPYNGDHNPGNGDQSSSLNQLQQPSTNEISSLDWAARVWASIQRKNRMLQRCAPPLISGCSPLSAGSVMRSI
jgi:hypothetical protein